MKSFQYLRIGAVAAALTLVIPVLQAADTTSLPTKYLAVKKADQSYEGFIVTYKNGSTERNSSTAAMQKVNAAIGRTGLNKATMSSNVVSTPAVSASYKRKLAVGSDLIHTSRKLSQSEANTLMAEIAADPAVAYVQPDYRMYAVRDIKAPASMAKPTDAPADPFAPNDPDYANYQWNFSNAIGGANVNNAWNIADGTGVTVAVIDTGITKHPDLDTSLGDAGYDFIESAAISGRPTDGTAPGGWDLGDWTTTGQCYRASPAEGSSWHGTNVAGVIGELTNNSVGMAGIAYNAKVLPIRVLGHCGGTDSDISDAIVWASGGHVDGVPDNTHPAQVISMSLGGAQPCSPEVAEYQAIQDAISRGVAVVVAAGNDNEDVSNATPASCPGVIAVASNGITGKRAFYSNYGTGITISAPGGGIYQNDASSGQQANPEGFVWAAINPGTEGPLDADPVTSYEGMAGTSQATPHVTGTVAMMISAAREAGLSDPTPAQIHDILAKSARPFPVVEDQQIGTGILDAYAAVNMVVNGDGNGGGGDDPSILLTKGTLLPGQSATSGSILYSIDVPAGAKTLNLRTLGGTGNVALYVKAGSAPAADGSNADFKSVKPGTSEAVVIQTPQATTYYLRVAPQQGSSFSNISVLADYNP
ncbi:S8 family peptidase [Dyella nitratireducens]|uniref:Protease n=1 Tax=Dyella nitratireducens TaxID=1849580 RepID=A0ABQ1FZ33_9GAMM|nr:S8 family peptidase [Dyella nitratireducens]GGA34059.1 protease [Dyella nitratireducens]GLQ40809.1 protease [Dyella nitratireducens]